MELRPAETGDLELILAWRNHPQVYSGCYTQSRRANPLITWEEHLAWWQSRANWREFLIVHEGRRVGIVTIGQLDHWSPEIGYLVGETTLWGKGIGREAVRLALQWLSGQGYGYCHTTVLRDNTRSLNLLKGLGFKVTGEARKDELWLTLTL